ncbi:hypothetical protein B0H17DRAFT_1124311 [Mycena rosella]|uniref:Uncharacterized protein n=1 Tax=Mycena rosella TaxID=1033263 RepID=A0AAD7H120_MYCRO|nr:hypothetical protein B0H17DRAFT_1124311 [Mycena rosella]
MLGERRTRPPSRITETIHTLRGEYFRHTQNIAQKQKRVLPNLKTTSLTHNSPTLPANLLADSAYSTDKPRPARDTREALFVSRRPDPPQHDPTTTPTQRAEALSVVLPIVVECHQGGVPPLTLMCLQILITSSFEDDFFETILPFIPTHLRHDLLRWTAVHYPLTNHQLHALCGPEGHVGGELVVIGPNATVCEDQFKSAEQSRSAEWESDDWRPLPPMHTFILVSGHIGFSTLCSLPATLTHLALINLPAPVSLHRLPSTCPLVECLDLSYNTWLVAEKEARERLGTVKWSRWHQLHKLGFRGCQLPADIMVEVNKGRWDDVRVVV